MSLGAAGEEIADVERIAIDSAIAAGVIVVTSAGNEGVDGTITENNIIRQSFMDNTDASNNITF